MRTEGKLMLFDTLATLATRIASRGAVFLVLLVLAIKLTPAEIGYYGLIVTTSYAFIFLFSLGYRHSIAFFIAKEQIELPKIYSAVSVCVLFLSLFSFLSAFIIFSLIFTSEDPSYLPVFSSIIFVPMVVSYVLQGFFIGRGDITEFNKSEMVSKNFLLLSTLCSLWLFEDFDLKYALCCLCLSNVAGLLYIYVKVFSTQRVNNLDNSSFFDLFIVLRGMFYYGIPLTLALSFSALSPTACILILKMYVSVADIGVFFLAYKFTEIIAEAATSAGMVTFSRGVRDTSDAKFLRSSVNVARLLFLFSLMLIFMSLPFIRYFSWYLKIENLDFFFEVLLILSFGLPFLSFSKIAHSALSVDYYSKYCLYNQAFCFIICVLACFLFVHGYGVYAAIYGLLLSRIVCMALYVAIYSNALGVSFFSLLFSRLKDE